MNVVVVIVGSVRVWENESDRLKKEVRREEG